MKKVLIVGQGGRESSIVSRLSGECSVYSIMSHENPTIMACVEASGGRYLIVSPSDVVAVTDFAVQHQIDLAVVSSDEPLAAGVVDSLMDAGIRVVGPTKSGSQVEWDKEYSINLMCEHFPSLTPAFWVVRDETALLLAINEAKSKNLQLVVKPQGLTAGKGVKVMGAHLRDFNDVAAYSRELLQGRPNECVLLVEKVTGVEFTIMFLTDGVEVVPVPATYDYPYRFDGDLGPGTGGMGAFSCEATALPFMTEDHYAQCMAVARKILAVMKADGRHFNGVLNAGFFVTNNGLKFLEFNARFGDPECMNIMMALEGSALSLFEQVTDGTLRPELVRFARKATVVKYLVNPDYALSDGSSCEFVINVDALAEMGIQTFFSSATRIRANLFGALGNSRCVALAAVADSPDAACRLIEDGISRHVLGELHWRKDVGSADYISRLTQQCA